MAYGSSNRVMVVIGLLEQNVWAELVVVWACITAWHSLEMDHLFICLCT